MDCGEGGLCSQPSQNLSCHTDMDGDGQSDKAAPRVAFGSPTLELRLVALALRERGCAMRSAPFMAEPAVELGSMWAESSKRLVQ